MNDMTLAPLPWRRGEGDDNAFIFGKDKVAIARVFGVRSQGLLDGLSLAELKSHRRARKTARMMTASFNLYACVYTLVRSFPWGKDEEIDGADLINWLNEQMPYWKDALNKADGGKRK